MKLITKEEKIKKMRNLKIIFIQNFIYLKLKLKGKFNVKKKKSGLSNSRYVIYDAFKNYEYYCDIKIRISDHKKSDNDNSNIFIYV